MTKKRTIKIVSIVLVVVLLVGALFAVIPFLIPEKTKFEFYTSGLNDEKSLYPTSHDGRTFYVAADGGDWHNDGTIEKPYSLDYIRWFTRTNFEDDKPVSQREIDEPFFKPGDQILLKRGDVFKTNLEINYCHGDEDNPITIASYGDSDKRPIIEIADRDFGGEYQETLNTGSVAGVILHKCSNIVVRDLEIHMKWKSRLTTEKGCAGIYVGYDQYGARDKELGYDSARKYENIYVVNNVIHSECVNVVGKFDYDKMGNKIEINPQCEANTQGISLNSYHLTYEDSPNDFIFSGFYCTNNLVYNVGRSGITAHGWIQDGGYGGINQMKFTIFTDVHLDNNIVHDVGTIGIFAGASTGCTMNRNLVYNTGMYKSRDYDNDDAENHNSDSKGEGNGGIMSMCLKDGEIKYNVNYNNFRQNSIYDGIGIDIDWNSLNIVVEYNYVFNSEGPGIGTMGNANSKILNNRVEDNPAHTVGSYGQILVSDYLPANPFLPPEATANSHKLIGNNSEDLLSLRNLEVAGNLIKSSNENGKDVIGQEMLQSLFLIIKSNGERSWQGNNFHNNHVVHSGKGRDFSFIRTIDNDDPDDFAPNWYSFSNNKYYAYDLTSFICEDATATLNDIDTDNGAILVPTCTDFKSWAKRDLGSTFEKYTPNTKPGKPSKAKVEFKNGKLSLTWKKSSGDIWHYNIYKVREGEEISYRNLLEQTKTTSFNFTPEEKGTFYIVIQPENNMGIVGEALKLKISLK